MPTTFTWPNVSQNTFIIIICIVVVLAGAGLFIALRLTRNPKADDGSKYAEYVFVPPRPSAGVQGMAPPQAAHGCVQAFDWQWFNDEYRGINAVNQWLADCTQIGNVKCKFHMGRQIDLLVNTSKLEGVVFRYDVLPKENAYQYAVVQVEDLGFTITYPEELLAYWMSVNPGVEIITWYQATHQRMPVSYAMFSEITRGFGGFNRTQLYLLVRFRRTE